MKKIKLDLYMELDKILKNKKIVDCTFGSDFEICILTVTDIPNRINGMFVPTITENSRDYTAYIIKDKKIKIIHIPNQKMNYHFFQVIDEYEILLACARSHYYNENNIEKNCKIFDYLGNKVREFCIGDGIQDLKTTKNGNIWTSYFDEGIFGNYGWADPIGKSGLLSWDKFGNKIYEYPQEEPHFISDCYSLNVLNNDKVLIYYYSDFEVAYIDHTRKITYAKPDLSSASGMIYNYKYLWLQQGYSKQDKFIVYKTNSLDSLRKIEKVQFLNEYGKSFNKNKLFSDFRANKLLFLSDTKLYMYDIDSITKF